jgi:hypothetical protein
VLAYRVNGPFVELFLDQTHPYTTKRAVFEAMRDDRSVSDRALMLIESGQRIDLPSEAEIRARLRMFQELLPRFAPVWAVVVSPALLEAAKPLQRFAREAGLRIGLFTDVESARRWLGVYASADE